MRRLAARRSPLAVQIDQISLVVTCSPKMTLKELEGRLRRDGYTLGYRPVVKRALTLLEALEKRVPNRLAPRYGGIEDICVRLKVIRKGQVIATRNVPRAATGPDFKKIFIGSRGRYGRIIEATLKVRHA